MDIVELSRMVENLIRVGTIHSVDHGAERCRVTSGELTTNWLRWCTPRAGATKTWDPPTVGEQCTVFSPSGDVAAGIVFYGINSSGNPAPSHSPNEHVIAYPDGARITYDHASSHLSVTGIKTAIVRAEIKVTLDTPMTHCTGELMVDDLLTYKNGINGSGGTSNHNIITGDFLHDEGVMSSHGVDLSTHRHRDVQPGVGESGEPVL